MILLLTSNSSGDPGVLVDEGFTDGYSISHRATMAAFRRLTRERIETDIYDCGCKDEHGCVESKIRVVNCLSPALAVEIRVGAKPALSGLILPSNSPEANVAAEYVSKTMTEAFKLSHHGWRSSVESEKDEWLKGCKYPSVAVEALNSSSVEQMNWLIKNGAEAYGLLVADSLLAYLRRSRS